MFQFPKKQKLCNKKEIKVLFNKGNNVFIYPFQLIWSNETKKEDCLKTLFLVPKKKVKLANKRNRLKRRIKEAYRLQKRTLEMILKCKNKQLNIAIIYKSENIYKYSFLEKKINLLLKRLKNIL